MRLLSEGHSGVFWCRLFCRTRGAPTADQSLPMVQTTFFISRHGEGAPEVFETSPSTVTQVSTREMAVDFSIENIHATWGTPHL